MVPLILNHMRVFVVDISGKVINYDIAFCEAIHDELDNKSEIVYFAPLFNQNPKCKTIRLINLIPLRYKNSVYLWKRAIKFIELIINYIYILYYIFTRKPDVVHFQWFPLLEICSGENLVLKIVRILSGHSQIVYTIHNLFPHELSIEKRSIYVDRFKRIAALIDTFIVHTEKTKKEVSVNFNISEEIIHIVHHGIFIPHGYYPCPNKIENQETIFIMYGNLTDYKGVDLFVEAIKDLPEHYRKRVRGIIAGEMQNKKLCYRLQEESRDLNIEWYPYFLPDKELYEKIDNSNVIVLPYKQISQSGVLLLALYFRRFIITSDLPTFKETLKGFSDDMFFESENTNGLAQLMMRFVDDDFDKEKQMQAIENLNRDYSWNTAAKKMIKIYLMII